MSEEIPVRMRTKLRRFMAGRRGIARVTLILVLVGLTWRLGRYAMAFPLWGDEAFVAMNIMTRNFGQLLGGIEYYQVVPPGYLWAQLAVVKMLGASECPIRLVAFLAGAGALIVHWRLALRMLDRRSAMLAVGIFAATYYLVHHGTEVKPYTTDLLVSVVLTLLAWTILDRGGSMRKWAALTVMGAAGVWLSYPSIFVCGAIAVVLGAGALRRRNWRSLVPVGLFSLIVSASFVAVYLLVIRPQTAAAAKLFHSGMWSIGFPPVSRPWLIPWWLVKVHTGRMLAYPVGGKNFASTATFVLVCIGGVSMWRHGRRKQLALLLGPMLVAMLAAALKRYPYGGTMRTMLYLAPAMCMLAGAGLLVAIKTCVRPRRVRRAVIVAAALLAVVAFAGLIGNIIRPYKTKADLENRQAVQDLAGRTAPGDRWVVFNALGSVPYAPNIYDAKGSAARCRYYLTLMAKGPIRYAPPPDSLTTPQGGRLRLLVYRHRHLKFDDRQLRDYLDVISARLGQPTRKDYSMRRKGGTDVLETYLFPGQKLEHSTPAVSRPRP